MAKQVWFTADTHFGHGNIIKYCQRPFLTVEELEAVARDPRSRIRISDETVRRHDEALLDVINSRVQKEDELWILGDFCMGSVEQARRYREQIHCTTVNLVWGNHDNKGVGVVFSRQIHQGMIRVENQDIWLNHYPMRSWDCAFHGSWHLYGHVHGRYCAEDARNPGWLVRDVGVDACDYKPISFAELREYMAPRIAQFHENKRRLDAGETTPTSPL